MKWFVKMYDVNRKEIRDYDVFQCLEKEIKEYKKKCPTKKEFKEEIISSLRYHFWSRTEWEMLLYYTPGGYVYLGPLFGKDREEVGDEWIDFAKWVLSKKGRDGIAKIDVFDQMMFRIDDFVDRCWYTKLRYQRDDPKFHRGEG